MSKPLNSTGLMYGVAAYTVWGLFPIFMYALRPAGAFEIVAHRALWSLAVCLIVLLVVRGWRRLGGILRDRRAVLLLAVASALIAVNWGVMVYAVITDRVASTSLGYYFNPLVTVALSVVFLGERLRRLQIAAIALATVAVVAVAIDLGGLPWISLSLALSFALYSFIKKAVGGGVDALSGLTVETAFIAPVAAGVLWWGAAQGDYTFTARGAEGLGLTHDLYMAATGVWTAGALLLFAAGARRLPLNVTGMLQYIAPTMTFALAVWYFHEQMSWHRWLGFALVWVALVMITWDSWRAGARSRRAAAVEPVEPVG